uniref:DNA-directed RNA polymerase n=1 Tax=Heligmosomoides polygyrus TaxID=6339 RepID=A0A183G187_HELPZ
LGIGANQSSVGHVFWFCGGITKAAFVDYAKTCAEQYMSSPVLLLLRQLWFQCTDYEAVDGLVGQEPEHESVRGAWDSQHTRD